MIKKKKSCGKYKVKSLHMTIIMGEMMPTCGFIAISRLLGRFNFLFFFTSTNEHVDQCCAEHWHLKNNEKREQEEDRDIHREHGFYYSFSVKVKKVHPFYLSFIFHLNSVWTYAFRRLFIFLPFYSSIGHNFAAVAMAEVFCGGVFFFYPPQWEQKVQG